jgi:murein DD-endopeptidase MepM/ murein hydrolase activator NlpD
MRAPLNAMKIRTHQAGRYAPLSNTFGNVRAGNTRAHQGWDLEASPGTAVFAISDGEVTSGSSPTYGTWLSLRFSWRDKPCYAFYAHLSNVLVKDASVREGAIIGFTGRSGNAARIPVAEAHLHFEIRTVEHPGLGLPGRIDPGEVLGYRVYAC